MPRPIPKRAPSPDPPVDEDVWPPPFRRANPQPQRRRMPEGWKPDKPFDYLLVRENFTVGARIFNVGQRVPADDLLANKLMYECPEWVHVVRLADIPQNRKD